MLDQQFIALVIGVSMAAGAGLGGYIAHRTHMKHATRTINEIITNSVKATSILATMFIDSDVEHSKCTPDESMQKVIKTMQANGVQVAAYKVRGGPDVHKIV